VEGFIAQVLQRRSNHDTFRVYRVDVEKQPELARRFGIDDVPTLLVVEENKVRGRLEQPRGCQGIERFLAPWLH
jgi:thioredoxin-like negative regulator of GroEL